MVAAERTVLVLLAAGRSTRFGSSKLDEDLGGKPLGLHAAETLASVPFLARVAVVGDTRLDYAARGFHVVTNRSADRDQASSLRLAVTYAETLGADALLVTLADMPCITAAHVARLLDAANGSDAVIASSNGGALTPPALFGRAHFDALLAVTGDRGARHLIRAGLHIVAPGEELVDVDTPADLAALRATS